MFFYFAIASFLSTLTVQDNYFISINGQTLNKFADMSENYKINTHWPSANIQTELGQLKQPWLDQSKHTNKNTHWPSGNIQTELGQSKQPWLDQSKHTNNRPFVQPRPKASQTIESCLSCLCQINSGCQNKPCREDRGSPSCGYFQLKSIYWQDCGSPGRSFESCASDYNCSENCVREYFKRYAYQLEQCAKDTDLCLTLAQMHTYGAFSCKTNDIFNRAGDMKQCLSK